MRRLMKRDVLAAASAVLILSAGCGSSTEIPLANVAPVAAQADNAKVRPPSGIVTSPPHIEGHN